MTEEATESPPEDARKPAARTPARPWRALALAFAGGTLLLLVLLWSLRSAIVTSLVVRALSGRGIECAGLSVSASGLLDTLTVAPSRCLIERGDVVEVRWDAPITATMEGGSVGAVSADVVHVVRRRHPADQQPMGDLLRAPERVGGVLRFASRLSELDSPHLTAARIEVVREGDGAADLTLVGLEIPLREASVPVEASVAEISLAPITGPLGVAASPRLTTVVVHAERTRGTLAGTLDTHLDMPMLGTLRLGGLLGEQRVEVVVEGLDEPEPRFSIRSQN